MTTQDFSQSSTKLGSNALAAQDKKRLHVISNTHWDREWRYSIWQNRQLLVELIDSLIELMEQHSEYKHYILDGQSVVVQDYLEIRPEHTQRLKALIQAGRIQVGPWYTLPHQFAVTGESLVRNLLTGIRMADEYGRACMTGYTIFSFGQVAQLPQIYAGFGIDKIMTCKRVSKTRAPFSEFLWESPDGTRALTTRYGDHGRGNYYYFLFIPVSFGMGLWDRAAMRVNPQWEYDYSKGGRPFHMIDKDMRYQDTFLLDTPYKWHPELISQGLEDCMYTVRESTVKNPKLFSEGADFCNPTIQSIKIIEEANKHLHDSELIHSNVELYMDELSKAVDHDNLKVVTGELKDGPAWAVQASIHSTGIPVRLKNFASETNIISIAEPLAVMASSVGFEYPKTLLHRAWEYLMQSHAHDSINGYGDKSVWFNTINRLDQVADIAETITAHSIKCIVKNIDCVNENENTILVTVFNTLAINRDADVEISIDFPGNGCLENFKLVDFSGSDVPFQILERKSKKHAVISPLNRPLPYNAERFTIRALFKAIPACGYRTYKVIYQLSQNSALGFAMHNKHCGTLLTAPNTIENKFLLAHINFDGTLDITRKETGHTYKGLLYFEDRGNTGICHLREYPQHDQVITSHGCKAKIALIEDGPYCCAFKVNLALSIPEGLDTSHVKRNNSMLDLNIEYIVRLTSESDFVDVEMEVDNNARNHTLRMVFPTYLATAQTHSDAPFGVATRTLAERSPQTPADWPMDEHPCYSFVDINDGKEGLAVLTGGLPSYELLYRNDRPLCLTLVRSYDCRIDCGESVMNLYPEWEHTQVMGKHRFHFALFPHRQSWQQAKLVSKASEYSTPVRVAQHGIGRGPLPIEKSWLSIEPLNIQLSCVKRSETGESTIIRLYNTEPTETEAKINTGSQYNKAWICKLNEERSHEVNISDQNMICIPVPNFKIVTIELAN
ncbi:MAG: hypothetical protein A2Y12_09310 [Planctomycetes bacterium GWF2_42_9]|nr:MAG: hypothetical protein A2Y12_09310 [Planctomycetes bacterium GWF2_42_9]